MSWIINKKLEENYEGSQTRTTIEQGDYTIEEEKVGDLEDPDYTIVRVFEEKSFVTGQTYEGDGSRLKEADLGLQEFNNGTESPLEYLSEDREKDILEKTAGLDSELEPL